MAGRPPHRIDWMPAIFNFLLHSLPCKMHFLLRIEVQWPPCGSIAEIGKNTPSVNWIRKRCTQVYRCTHFIPCVIRQIEIATGTLKYGIDSFLRQVCWLTTNPIRDRCFLLFCYSWLQIIYNQPFNIDFVLHFIGLIEKQNRTFFEILEEKKLAHLLSTIAININK